MARTSLAFHVLGLFCVTLLMQKCSARQFTVGGEKGWTVPDNTNVSSYNQWAENNRFQIGDSLLFVYNSDSDSVLRVTVDDYTNCTSTAPIANYTDGHTVFTFNQSGPHYFISGNKDNCVKNEKLVVVVLADRSNGSPPSPAPETVPSPAPETVPSPPAPSAPTGTVDISPTPPPATKHKNAASSTVISVAGSVVGAFFASSLILVL